jgi:hypothetical protein
MALLLILVLIFAVAAPALAFAFGSRAGYERGRQQALAEERQDLLDRMERAQYSQQPELLAALSEVYRSRFRRGGEPQI